MRPGYFTHFVRDDESRILPSSASTEIAMDVPFRGLPPGWDVPEHEDLDNLPKADSRAHLKRRKADLDAAKNRQVPNGLKANVDAVEFGLRDTCIVHMEEVVFENVAEVAVVFTRVSIDESTFHHSFFDAVTLRPHESLTVQVAFLPPRSKVGYTAWMSFKTSVGSFDMRLSGMGMSNRFGVESLNSIRLPPVLRFTPHIVLRNSFENDLEILEAFSTSDFFQLALPAPKLGDVNFMPWVLMPNQTKTVLHLAFSSPSQGRFHGFIVLKTNKGTLFLRVDLLVATGGIFVPTSKLEFFTLTSPTQKKRLRILLHLSGVNPSTLLDMYPEDVSANANIRCKFTRGNIIIPNVNQVMGEVEFSGEEEGVFSGRIVLETSDKIDPILYVPYSARVIHGSLKFSVSNTTFYTPGSMSKGLRAAVSSLDAGAAVMPHSEGDVVSGEAETDHDGAGEIVITQTQELTNSFHIPITLFAVALDDPRFTVLNFEPGVTIAPNATYRGLEVQYRGPPDPSISRLRLSLQSNVAREFAVPIWTFHGRLAVSKTDIKTWERFGDALPSLYSDLSLRGVVTKETVVCEGNCLAPKYHQHSPSFQELTALFNLFGMEKAGATPPPKDLNKGMDEMITLVELSSGGGETLLDFGTLSLLEVRRARINVTNLNPRDIKLHRFTSDIPSLNVKFEFVQYSRTNQIILYDYDASQDEGLWIRSGHSAIFTLTVTGAAEERTNGKLVIETWFETREIHVMYETLAGSLEIFPKAVDFAPSFPGNVKSIAIHALSTYRKPLSVLSVRCTDDRLVPVIRNHTLASQQNMSVAVVWFDPGRLEQGTAPALDEATRRKWSRDLQYVPAEALKELASFGVSKREVDKFNANEYLWSRLRATGRDVINATVTVHTNIVARHEIPISAKLKQPFLGDLRELSFPLTQYGSSFDMFILMSNPSDSPVVLESAAFFTTNSMDEETAQEFAFYANEDAQGVVAKRPFQQCSFHLNNMVTLGGERKRLEEHPITILPHETHRFGPVTFRPQKHPGSHGALLLIKNNLTQFHVISLSGEAGTSVVRLLDGRNHPIPHRMALNSTLDPFLYRTPYARNRGPPLRSSRGIVDSEGQGELVIFTLEDFHVDNCTDPKGRKEIQLSKEFSIQNNGIMPLFIHATLIGHAFCSFKGLRVEPCLAGLWIAPREMTNVTVYYVPDFSSSVVRESLHVITSVGTISMTLLASIPHKVLSACHFARPEVSETASFWLAFVRVPAFLIFVSLLIFTVHDIWRQSVPSRILLKKDQKIVSELKAQLEFGRRRPPSPIPVAPVAVPSASTASMAAPLTPKEKKESWPGRRSDTESTSASASASGSSEDQPTISPRKGGGKRHGNHKKNSENSVMRVESPTLAIVKESVSIPSTPPTRSGRSNRSKSDASSPSTSRSHTSRTSSDSRGDSTEESFEEDHQFSFRFEGVSESLDVPRFALRLQELMKVDPKKLKVTLEESTGSFIAVCSVSGDSGEKTLVKVRGLLKSSKSSLSGKFGANVVDYGLGDAAKLEERRLAQARKEAKKAARRLHESSNVNVSGIPVVVASTTTATTAPAPVGNPIRAPRAPVVQHQHQQQQQQQHRSPPPPSRVPVVAKVSLAVPKPKRTFQPVDLFSDASSNSTTGFSLSELPPGFGDSPSPQPGMGGSAQGLLPRDLLTSSGGGQGFVDFSHIRLAKNEPAVPVQSLFGDWTSTSVLPIPLIEEDNNNNNNNNNNTNSNSNSNSDTFGADLISLLRAPQTEPSPSQRQQEDAELFGGLHWIDDSSRSDGLLLDVALEDDASLQSSQSEFFSLFQDRSE